MQTKDKKDVQLEIEESLRRRLENFGLPPGSLRGLKMQAEFLSGAMAALQAIFPDDDPERLSSAIPPSWVINVLSGRSTIETVKKP